jgi:hypothetical protein
MNWYLSPFFSRVAFIVVSRIASIVGWSGNRVFTSVSINFSGHACCLLSVAMRIFHTSPSSYFCYFPLIWIRGGQATACSLRCASIAQATPVCLYFEIFVEYLFCLVISFCGYFCVAKNAEQKLEERRGDLAIALRQGSPSHGFGDIRNTEPCWGYRQS